MKTVDFTGTVIERTMRVQDVLPAMMEVLDKYYHCACRGVVSAISEELGITYTELCGDQEDPAWGTEMMSWIVHELAWDAMDAIAPEGYYFGAHPGDGSDYGFWKDLDLDEETCCSCCGRSDLTLLTCLQCDELLCQDCSDTDAHICEPDRQDMPDMTTVLACTCGRCAAQDLFFTCEKCSRPTPWCRGADDEWPGLCDNCAVEKI